MTLYGPGYLGRAIADPGPPDKKYSTPNAAVGIVAHSMVGTFPGARSRLQSTERDAAGHYTQYAAASWHFSLLQTGDIIQHYDINASCWASGSAYPNTHFLAIELEGGLEPHNEPMTPAQSDSFCRLVADLAVDLDWQTIRRPGDGADVTAQLYEHRECIRWWSAATACPSDRYNWAQLQPQIEAMLPMNPTDEARIRAIEDRLAALAALIADRALDANRRLVAIEDKLQIPHA